MSTIRSTLHWKVTLCDRTNVQPLAFLLATTLLFGLLPLPALCGDVEEQFQTAMEQAADLMESGKFAEAITYVDRARELNAYHWEPYLLRGKCFAALQENELALKSFKQALDIVHNLPDVLLERGKLYLELGMSKQAVADLELAAEIKPANPEYLYYRGLAYARLASEAAYETGRRHKLTRALASFDRAVEMDADMAEAYYQRALTHAALGNEQEASAEMERAAKLGPTKTDFIRQLVTVNMELQRQIEALRNEKETLRERLEAESTQAEETPANWHANVLSVLTEIRYALQPEARYLESTRRPVVR